MTRSLIITRSLLLIPVVALLASGCHTTVVTTPPATDTPFATARSGVFGYHVAAGASTVLPAGDIGYAVTASPPHTYRIFFADTLNTAAVFAGNVSADSGLATFSNPDGGVNFTQNADGSLSFSGVPGAQGETVDVTSNSDPIYLNLTVDNSGSGFGIYFTGGTTGQVVQSNYNPVAFTSP
jgi:hypothetical protein